MMTAEKANLSGFSPGIAPDIISSKSATGPATLVMHLNQAYSSIWFTYNELSQFAPMPVAWDVTALSAKAGSGGCPTDSAADKWARCVAVYNFLAAQAKSASTYATSPIWGVVDGPWKTASYNTNGNVTMSPNPAYSGSPEAEPDCVQVRAVHRRKTECPPSRPARSTSAPFRRRTCRRSRSAPTLPSTNPLGSAYNLQPLIPFGFNYFRSRT